MALPVRVRFAPSPTGPLHIGGLRTALYNYLFAKKHEGTFVLRIEDTDSSRYVNGAEDYIKQALDWCGLTPDESPFSPGDYGPYRQSERKLIYKSYAETLVNKGHAYYAFDTAEELASLRKEEESKGEKFIYSSRNRNGLNNSLSLNKKDTEDYLASGNPYVIRFKMPVAKQLSIKDSIRGNIQVKTDDLDDKILFKSDGMPTYHLANIVDDHLMKITHVIRGEEWLPSLALHVLLYDAFGWKAPEFAHLPLILKPTGKGKLSKRDGDKHGFPVFPLEWKDPISGETSSGYREEYYLPEVVINMLALLGWNDGTEQELFSIEELIDKFSIDKVHKAGAKFNPDKTKWFQHQYILKVQSKELALQFQKWLNATKSIDADFETTLQITDLLKERITFLPDLWEESFFFFQAPDNFNPKSTKKVWKEGTTELMLSLTEFFETQDDFSLEALQPNLKAWIAEQGVGFGKIMMPLRLSLVGDMKGPDVFEMMSILGKTKVVERLNYAIKTL